MQVAVIVDSSSQRAWHRDLVRRLDGLPGVRASIRLADGPPPKEHRRLERLLRLEQLLHGLDPGLIGRTRLDPSAGATTGTATAADPEAPGGSIVLDLTARPAPGSWSVRYDGAPGEQAAAAALRCGRLPVVSVVDADGAARAQGRPGSERPGLLTTALADIGAGVSTLVVGAVTGSPFAAPADAPPTAARSISALPAAASPADAEPRSHLAIAARRVVGAAVHRLYRALYRAPHWRVGWRRPSERDVLAGAALGSTDWAELPDDGFHFYADPFPFEHEGATYLFVEDFDHRIGKAVISAVEWGPHGAVGTPRPVLQHEVHLSYPFVLQHDGDVWMIPESSGAKTLELYRAVSFPWTWERHSILLEGIEVSDATAFEHEGRWWLTATVGHGGSLSDSLCLWSAPDLRGPWTPHRHNPVLVDIASARPGGRVEQRDGRLLRPVQDGRAGYGAALSIAEITRLDDEGFEQRVVTRHAPGQEWGGTRLHTLNSGGGIETVDGSRMVPRFAPNRSPVPRGSAFVVAREDDLDFRGEEYARLYAGSGGSAFQHGVWLDRLYGRLAPARDARRCVVTVRAAADGRLVGVLPLVRRRRGLVRVVEYADLGVSDYAVPVIDRDWALSIRGDATVGRRIRELLGAFDLLLIVRATETSVPLVALLHGARTRAHSYGAHPAELAEDVASWRARLEPRAVRHLEKAYKRLRPKGGYAFRTATDPEEIDRLLEVLRAFRAARFGERGAVDLFQDPVFFEFYRAVARDSANGDGPAIVNVLEVGGQPAAVALDLLEPERELYVITGYDFAGLRNFSLGLLVVDQIAQAAIGRGARVLDMTVGDEPYKADFGARRRPLFQVYVARTPIGALAFAWRTLYLGARRIAKRALVAWRARRRRRVERTQANASVPGRR